MKKINENQKVTLTLGQLKRLVKETRYSDKLKDLDDPAYHDSPEQYADRKLRAQMGEDLLNIISNSKDLDEASDLLIKIKRILDNRLDGDAWNTAYDALNEAGFDDIMVYEDGDLDGKVGFGYEHEDYATGSYMIQVAENIQIIFYPNNGGIFTFSTLVNAPAYRYNEFIDKIMSKKIGYFDDDYEPRRDISDDDVKKIADAIHILSEKIPYVFDTVDKVYDTFIKINGIKLTEGRFADKLKHLDSLKLDEGRFADKLTKLKKFA